MKKSIVLFIICLFLTGCGAGNLDHVKDRAADKWAKQGFEIVDYEGYQLGFWFGPYGGAEVWYRLKKVPDNGITYSGMLERWGDEIHVYGPMAHDAIKPN